MQEFTGRLARPAAALQRGITVIHRAGPGDVNSALEHPLEDFDLVPACGHLVDPAQGRDGLFDVAIRAGRIAAVVPAGTPLQAAQRIDVRGHS